MFAVSAQAVDTYLRIVDGKFVVIDGVMQTGAATPSFIDYADIPEYLQTIGYFEMTSFLAGGIVINNAGSGTETLTNGVSAFAFTSEAETNGVSAYGSNDGGDKMIGSSFSDLQGASKATFSMWLKPNSTVATGDGILSKYLSAGDNISMVVDAATTGFIFVPASNGGLGNTTNAGHIANVYGLHSFVFDGTLTGNANRLKYYFNGIQYGLNFAGTIGATLATNTAELEIGVQEGVCYDGDIDTVCIWETALTSNNESNLFWATCWNNPDNKKDGVQINPGKGWTSGMHANRNNDLYLGADRWFSFNPAFSDGGRVASQPTDGNAISIDTVRDTVSKLGGISNGVANFATVEAYMAMGNVGDFAYGTNDFCFAMWVIPRVDTGAAQRLISKDDGSSDRQLLVQLSDTGAGEYGVDIAYWTAGNSVLLSSSVDILTTDTLCHLVCQRVGDSFEIWTNGVISVSGTTSGTHGTMVSVNEFLNIGRRNDGTLDFRGDMDDLYIRQGSLTTNQIQTLYGNGEGWK